MPEIELRMIETAAHMLNNFACPDGTSWAAQDYPLSRTAREDGKLACLVMWHSRDSNRAAETADHPAEVHSALGTLLDLLNATCGQDGARWYFDGLAGSDSPRVIATARFWLLTDECARAIEAGEPQR